MMQYGIEVLVVSNPSNMCYLTGYNAWSFYVHQVVVVFIDEKEPLWIGRGMDSRGAEQTTWMHPQNIMNYPDEYVQSTIKHPMDYVAEVLLEKGKGERKIGVEMDAFYYTAKCHERMLYELPEAELKDASGIVNWVRLIKSKIRHCHTCSPPPSLRRRRARDAPSRSTATSTARRSLPSMEASSARGASTSRTSSALWTVASPSLASAIDTFVDYFMYPAIVCCRVDNFARYSSITPISSVRLRPLTILRRAHGS